MVATVNNHLDIEAYSTGTRRVPDPRNELARAEGLKFSTGYPGGLYLDSEFHINRRVVEWLMLSGAQRLVYRNGMKMVYEGVIDSLEDALEQSGQMIRVGVSGQFGKILTRNRLRKMWCDDRVDEDVWEYDKSCNGSELCTVDRSDQIKFIPKAEAWPNGYYAWVKYVMPTGETVKRITFDYELKEGAQAWQMGVYDIAGATALWSVAASGSGPIDLALATPRQSVALFFQAMNNQTAKSDGTYSGTFANLKVYSESDAAINAQVIATDILGYCTALNSSVGGIGALTLTLEPFITDDSMTLADLLEKASGFGDASFNTWHYGLRSSESVVSPNGKPVLFLEQRPALTDYDYAVRWQEPNLEMPLGIAKDYSEIVNYVTVQYQDSKGKTNFLTPDDDAALKDLVSIATYGRQEGDPLDAGNATSTMAANYGKKHLARFKDPQWITTSAIQVKGHIRAKDAIIPACQVVAGKRLRIENYLQNLAGVGPNFLIGSTDYDAESQTVSITAGPRLPVYVAPFEFPPEEPEKPPKKPKKPKKKKKKKKRT